MAGTTIPRTRVHMGATQTVPGSGQTPASGSRRINIGKVGKVGAEKYLWILVALEIGTMAAMRHLFRKHHGG